MAAHEAAWMICECPGSSDCKAYRATNFERITSATVAILFAHQAHTWSFDAGFSAVVIRTQRSVEFVIMMCTANERMEN